MKLFSKTAVVALSVLIAAPAFARGLSVSDVQLCIHLEKSRFEDSHPLKARYVLEERDGSVANLIQMMQDNRAEMATLNPQEVRGPRGTALTQEFDQMNAVIARSNTCIQARKGTLRFVNDTAKEPTLKMELFFEQSDKNAAELQEWASEAQSALQEAGYVKALRTIDVTQQPALAILLVSGETTSVLERQYSLGYDSTMKTALRAIVGHDAPAVVLEDRLTKKMRAEALQRFDRLEKAAADLLGKE